MDAPTPEQRAQWREDAERWGRNKVMSRILLGDTDAAAVVLALLAALDAAERERDEAQEHIARWLDDNPPLSTTERVQRGSTGDLSFDMMRYAGRMKARAEQAEAALDRVRAALLEGGQTDRIRWRNALRALDGGDA